MKTPRLLAVLAIPCVALITGCTSPDIGHESVLIKKPLIFGHGGVAGEAVKPGLTFISPTTQAIDVNMQPQQGELKATDFMSSDGVPLDFDAIVRLQVTDSVRLIRDFGSTWYQTDVEREFSNLVRQQVRQHGMNETAISSTAIEAIDQNVLDGLRQYLARIHMPVTVLNVTVGKASPPDSVKSQRIETASQQQRSITEVQIKLAEDARKAAEESRAQADNAYRNALGLSPEQFIQLQRINMEKEVCLRNHCSFISGGGTPIVDGR